MSDIFDDKNQVKSAWVRWGKVGDWVKGTLVRVTEVKSTLPGKEGQKVKVYELKTDDGLFHETDENKKPVDPAVKCEAGAFWMIGGRTGLDAQMRRVKLGQKLGLKFTDEIPPKKKGFSPLKIIKVFTEGIMDEEWLSTYEPTAGDL